MAGRLTLALALALAACDPVATGLPPIGDVSDARSGDAASNPLVPVDGEVFVGTVTLRSKADEALFAGYVAIAGDLVITAQDAAGVRLDRLEHVTGSVTLQGSLGLEASGNLTLPKLTHIGKNLRASHTHSVGTLELPLLRTIGGHCELAHGLFELRTPRLEEVNGDLRLHDARLLGAQLPALATLGGSLRASRYAAATEGASLELDLPSLRSVGGDLELSAGPPTTLVARRLVALTGDLDLADLPVGLELPSLATVGGDLRLERLDVYLLALDSLTTVGGDLLLTDSGGAGLERLSLPSLATVAGRLSLTTLADTEALALDALADLGRALTVADNPRLATLSAASLPRLHSDLLVTRNALPLLVDLPSLAAVGGDLLLVANGALDARLGLLAAVTGDLRVTTTRITRLALPSLATVGRTLAIFDADASEGVLAFPSLTAVGGDLQLLRTAYVTTLLAPLLASVGQTTDGFPWGDLRLELNPHLATLDFSALTTVVGALTVVGNPALAAEVTDAAFGALTPGGALQICDNLEASPCE